MSGDAGLILARYGEIALKGRNFPRFLRQLRANMGESLRRRGIDATVSTLGRRIYVETEAPQPALEALSRVFGLTSLSPVVRVAADLEAIEAEALAELRRGGLSAASSFRVAARRADKGFPLTSPEINRQVGAYINLHSGARVDLSDGADHTVGIEIQHDHALVYARVVPGAGGMPIPLSGRVVALMSVGLDSPVAAWMMAKRGCAVIPLHFSLGPEGEERVRGLCAALQEWTQGWKVEPIIVSHREACDPVMERLRDNRAERWNCLFCKRTMLRLAEEVARKHRAQGIVLGDSLGQVASQTLESMRVISAGRGLPIFRPLIGLDKVEIMALARRIGTYDISAQATPSCPFLPERPLTSAAFGKFEALRPLVEP